MKIITLVMVSVMYMQNILMMNVINKKCAICTVYYVAAKATYIRLLYGQKGGFSALAP